jgi:hypothetical protein
LATIDDTQAVISILNDDGSLDYGDAPDPSYPVLLANNGARHLMVPAFRLGALEDSESNGKPSAQANGDDLANLDDEDGVVFNTPLMREFPTTVTVNASASGMLDAFIDFNGDGDWTDAGEHILFNGAPGGSLSMPLVAGDNVLNFNVPRSAKLGTTFARFRFSSTGGLAPTGTALDGEVEDYLVPIQSNVQLQNRQVVALGSSGNDVFKFWAGTIYVVELNGVVYKYDSRDVDSIHFDGGAGYDTVFSYGDPGKETATLSPDHGTIAGSRYTLTAVNIESTSAFGGGGADEATLQDSAGTDVFTVYPNSATLTGPGFYMRADGFAKITGQSGTGGSDTARLYDGTGDDTFIADSLTATLSGPGFTSRADNFRYAQAYTNWDPAKSLGFDVARLSDSTGNDVFSAGPTSATMYGAAFYVKANQFEIQEGYSTSGGVDIARLDGAIGQDDALTASPTQMKLVGMGRFSSQATGFRYAIASATAGDNDTAKLYDSPNVDTFVGTPTYATLSDGATFSHRVSNFKSIEAYSQNGATGSDTARLYDSGKDESFVADPVSGRLSANDGSYWNRANNFRYVHAYSTAGGFDVASFVDSTATDTFVGYPTYAALYSNSFYRRANYFDVAEAFSNNGGGDLAQLYDSAGVDALVATADYALLSGPGFSNRANKFRYVNATSASGMDQADLYDSAGDDTLTFSVSASRKFSARMNNTAGTYDNMVSGFPVMRAHAGTGTGYDQAKLTDLALGDFLDASGDTARFYGAALDFDLLAKSFQKVTATASGQGTNKKRVTTPPPLDFVLETFGPWLDY